MSVHVFHAFGEVITPERAHELNPQFSVTEYVLRAMRSRTCEGCGHHPEWRYVGLGLCFSCVTGETDASDDYELIPVTPPWGSQVRCPHCSVSFDLK
jgi:hypothetical protein